MKVGMYEAKRVLRAPLIWRGRRQTPDASPGDRWRLEHQAYRRKAQQAWANTGVDPMYFYRADLDRSSIAVDVGAFKGHVAQDLHDLYGCRVYAFEPDPTHYEQLDARFVDDPDVTTFPWGLGGEDAVLPLLVKGLGSTVHSAPGDGDTTVEVQIRDVQATLEGLGHDRIDYLKLNIEGAEYDVLDRLYEMGWNPRIRYFLIQFHEWLPGADRRRWRIRHRLRQTHEQVWSYPWIYELWCAKDDPHPPPPKFSRAEMAAIRKELAGQRNARDSAGSITDR